MSVIYQKEVFYYSQTPSRRNGSKHSKEELDEAYAVAAKMKEQVKFVTSGKYTLGFDWESFIRFCEDIAKERPEFYRNHIVPLRNVFDEIKDSVQGSMELYVDFDRFDSINWDRVTSLGSITFTSFMISPRK